MNLDLIRSQSIAQFSSLFSNSQVLSAIKSATKNDKTGKFDSLLENLEKLNQSITDANLSENSETNDFGLLKNNTSTDKVDTGMQEAINKLIADAELMESMLDLEITPSTEELFDLLAKFRQIITQLDQEMRKIQEEVNNKKTKEEYKLLPSSSTKSGFNESITLVAK